MTNRARARRPSYGLLVLVLCAVLLAACTGPKFRPNPNNEPVTPVPHAATTVAVPVPAAPH